MLAPVGIELGPVVTSDSKSNTLLSFIRCDVFVLFLKKRKNVLVVNINSAVSFKLSGLLNEV